MRVQVQVSPLRCGHSAAQSSVVYRHVRGSSAASGVL
jgi:hypothetical protein